MLCARFNTFFYIDRWIYLKLAASHHLESVGGSGWDSLAPLVHRRSRYMQGISGRLHAAEVSQNVGFPHMGTNV